MDLFELFMLNTLRISSLTLLVWSIPVLSLAETVYVSDNLRVGVRAEPNNSIAPHGVVITGMSLEVLERSNGFIKIRNASGVEGWIKDSYTSAEKPAKLELTAVQAEQAKLQTQLATQDKLLRDANAKSEALTAKLKTLTTANSELRQQLAETKQGETAQASRIYIGYLVLLLVLVGGGFVAGVVWHRQQAMKRLGGLRV